jgi:signal transduction histidine kinase
MARSLPTEPPAFRHSQVSSRKPRRPGAKTASEPLASAGDSPRQLQALAQASLALTTELSLERVLQKIAEVARDVLGARYAALGVINESGTGLNQFLTAGIDDTAKRAIGPLPTGKGVLGLLITERRPLRIRTLASHPQSAGFPVNHPPMGSFLGVPIMVRDKAYGNLYVTEKQDGAEFSETDESIALMLASQAAIAIENALIFQTLRQTQQELEGKERQASHAVAQMQALVQASLALTTELSLERVLQTIAEVARDVLHARYAALGVINESGTGLSQFLTAGVDDDTKRAIGPLPTGKGVLGLLIRERRPIRMRALAAHAHSTGFPANHPPMDSFLGVPIMVRDKAYGNLYVTEKQGAEEFSDADESVALMLASQAAIAIENAYAFQALHEAQEELVRKEKLATLGQLAGGVGHELRNPLGVIKNSVYYLNMILPQDAKIQKHLGILDREVANSNRIVTELLDFARVKAPVRETASLVTIVRAALERLPLPDTVTVRLEPDESTPAVLVDPQQVGQVVLNFLLNAVQAMPDGGTMTVSVGQDDATVFAAVEDTGVGVPPENLAKIFQPLFTTKAKGIGLGLALARDLADANGGRITIESTVGRGTRFALHFEKAASA